MEYSNTEYKSYSMIKLFSKSPELYNYRYNLGKELEPSPEMDFGSAFHTFMLDGEKAFNTKYFTDLSLPDVGRTSKTYKDAFAELEKLNEGKIFIKKEDMKKIQDMSDSLMKDAYVSSLLLDFEENERELYATINGRKFKGRPDKYNTRTKTIIDLKTCTDHTLFEKDANRHKYFLQQSLYKKLCYANFKKQFDFVFIAIQKKEPYMFDCFSFTDVDDQVSWDYIQDMYDKIITCEKNNCFIYTKYSKPITISQWALDNND